LGAFGPLLLPCPRPEVGEEGKGKEAPLPEGKGSPFPFLSFFFEKRTKLGFFGQLRYPSFKNFVDN
jgi:hypothetical protein